MKRFIKLAVLMLSAFVVFFLASFSSKAASGFDAKYYSAKYPEVVKSVGNSPEALEQYHNTKGVLEGKYASAKDEMVRKLEGLAALDTDYYAAKYPDVVAKTGTDTMALLNHYLQYGIKEGRYANYRQQVRRLTATELFNAEFYARKYPDVVKMVGSSKEALLTHFLTYGAGEGRFENASLLGYTANVYGGFDEIYYAKKYPEIAKAVGTEQGALLEYYMRNGKASGTFSCKEQEERKAREEQDAIEAVKEQQEKERREKEEKLAAKKAAGKEENKESSSSNGGGQSSGSGQSSGKRATNDPTYWSLDAYSYKMNEAFTAGLIGSDDESLIYTCKAVIIDSDGTQRSAQDGEVEWKLSSKTWDPTQTNEPQVTVSSDGIITITWDDNNSTKYTEENGTERYGMKGTIYVQVKPTDTESWSENIPLAIILTFG